MLENRITVLVTLAVLLYFLWMDVALFYHVSTRSTSKHSSSKGPSEKDGPNTPPELVSPFTGLSVKMMMMDPVNNYIHTPAAHIFNEVTHFSQVFYFITPNMVSFVGLLFALGAAKCMCQEWRPFHYGALFLFQMRTWFDALDGIVARSRMGMVQHVSLRNTSGYVVDGVADALGFVAFLVGCFQYLRTSVPKSKHFLPLNNEDACIKDSKMSNGTTPYQHPSFSSSWSQRRIFFVVFCFGLQLAVSAFFWDHYIDAYHTLLEIVGTVAQSEAQNEVLRSPVTWIIMWFWRLSNAHTFIQMLLYAICINKMWEFLCWIQYIGFIQIFTLAFLTELHLSTVRSFILSVA